MAKTRKKKKAKSISGYAPEEEQPRAKLVKKDGKAFDHGPVMLDVRVIERVERTKYRYSGEKDGCYRIFRE